MLNEGYHNDIEFALVGTDNARIMPKPNRTEEEFFHGRDNLLRHLVRCNVDVSNVRVGYVGTSLIESLAYRGGDAKFVKFCEVCKSKGVG
jgi:hypothetical protein